MPLHLPGPHISHYRLHVPNQGLAWEPGHWGLFLSFCCVTLGGHCPSLGLSILRIQGIPFSWRSSCLRFKIALLTPTATTAKRLLSVENVFPRPCCLPTECQEDVTVYTQTATSLSPILAPPSLCLPQCPRHYFLCH